MFEVPPSSSRLCRQHFNVRNLAVTMRGKTWLFIISPLLWIVYFTQRTNFNFSALVLFMSPSPPLPGAHRPRSAVFVSSDIWPGAPDRPGPAAVYFSDWITFCDKVHNFSRAPLLINNVEETVNPKVFTINYILSGILTAPEGNVIRPGRSDGEYCTQFCERCLSRHSSDACFFNINRYL